MLPIIYSFVAAVVLHPVPGLAQAGITVTGGVAVCTGETHQTVNQITQEIVTLEAQITQAQLALEDIEAMEQCAARQMVWVSGHATADAQGCISVEEFHGPEGDPGSPGEPGEDAVCP